MDIHQLKIFAKIYKKRSFTKSSEELFLTQPTVTEHIKKLENELGCKLFDRTSRFVIPTKEADLLYDYVIEIIDKLENVKNAIAISSKEILGKIFLATSTIPGTYIIPKALKKIKQQYPNLSFEVFISDSKFILEGVIKHDLMVGLVGTKIENDQLNFIPFLQDELVLVASTNLINKNKISLDELKKMPIIVREAGSGTRIETEKKFGEKGLDLNKMNISAVFGSIDAIKEAVKIGLGGAILSKLSVKEEIKNKILHEVKIEGFAKMKRNFYIVYHKKRTLPLNYKLFIDFVLSKKKDQIL